MHTTEDQLLSRDGEAGVVGQATMFRVQPSVAYELTVTRIDSAHIRAIYDLIGPITIELRPPEVNQATPDGITTSFHAEDYDLTVGLADGAEDLGRIVAQLIEITGRPVVVAGLVQ